MDMLVGHARWTCLREHGYLDMFTWTILGRYVADYVYLLNMRRVKRARKNRTSLRVHFAVASQTRLSSCLNRHKTKEELTKLFQVSGRSRKRKGVLDATTQFAERKN